MVRQKGWDKINDGFLYLIEVPTFQRIRTGADDDSTIPLIGEQSPLLYMYYCNPIVSKWQNNVN
jgi:hypothetical protein